MRVTLHFPSVGVVPSAEGWATIGDGVRRLVEGGRSLTPPNSLPTTGRRIVAGVVMRDVATRLPLATGNPISLDGSLHLQNLVHVVRSVRTVEIPDPLRCAADCNSGH